MRRSLAAVATALLLLTPSLAAAQTTIDFDGTGAPCSFSNTSPLTDAYAGLGVTFSGGGAVLNQCGNFGFDARSGTQFLAFNTSGYARGPEVLTFTAPIGFVSIFAARWSGDIEGSFTLEAFNSMGGLVGSTTINAVPATYTELAISGAAISSVRLSSTARAYAYDDLTFGTSTVPEPGTWALLATGLVAVGGIARRRARA